jgi:hypothetical protein
LHFRTTSRSIKFAYNSKKRDFQNIFGTKIAVSSRLQLKALYNPTTLIGKSGYAMKFNVIRLMALIVLAWPTAHTAHSAECTDQDRNNCTQLSEQSSRNIYDEQLAIYSSGSIVPLMHTGQQADTAKPSSKPPTRKPKAAVKPALRRLSNSKPPNVTKVYEALDSKGRRDLRECLSLMTDDEIRNHLPEFNRDTAPFKITNRPFGWFRRKAKDTDQTLCQNYFKSIFLTN